MRRLSVLVFGAVALAGCDDPEPTTCGDLDTGIADEESLYSATAISTGGDFTCGVTDQTTIVCWGAFAGAFYGGPQTAVLSSATPVMTLEEPITQLSAGAGHVCAVTASGALLCFGGNWAGQLGVPPECGANDNACPVPDPVMPPGLESGVVGVSAGQSHTCALKDDGRVLCFGMNWHGQTGETCEGVESYTECITTTPFEVGGMPGIPTAVFAGLWSSCATLDDGGVACWGSSSDGLLGNPDAMDMATNPTPWPVVGLTAPVVTMDIGDDYACAVLTDGHLACWGRCAYGQCGETAGTDQTSAELAPGLEGIASVGTSHGFTCVLQDDGRVGCFGGSTGNVDLWENGGSEGALRLIEGLPSDVSEIGVGYAHACALIESGAVYCWGDRENGQLGTESTGQAFPMQALGTDVVELPYPTCGITHDGVFTCQFAGSDKVVYPLGEDLRIKAYASGATHQCYLDLEGSLFCWGSNLSSQLGAIDSLDVSGPIRIEGVPSGLVDVSAREGSTIVLDSEGVVYLLTGPEREPIDDEGGGSWTEPPLPPLRVDDLGSGNRAVVDGSCVLRASKGVVCLNRSWDGETVSFADFPHIPAGTLSLLRRIDFACFLSEEGAVSCSGEYDYDQLGHGVDCPDPGQGECYELEAQQTVGLDHGVKEIAGGQNHTCALDEDGQVWCWGAAYSGALGDGTRMSTTVPVRVVGIPLPVVDIVADFGISCALVNCGAVYCWGVGIHSDYDPGPKLVRGF